MVAVVGVDPGPSTGLSALVWDAERRSWQIEAFQCTASSLSFLLDSVIGPFDVSLVAIEEFEVRRGSGGTTGKDADTTKLVRYQSEQIAKNRKVKYVVRKPGDVKPWATDKRLEKIGFPLGAKFRDARDSARHALFAGCKIGIFPDPLR